MARTARDVVFVDGVRTPFGKAGPHRPVRRDPGRRHGRQRDPRTDQAQPGAAARADRRGRHRRHDPDRRPGTDHRAQRRRAGRAAPRVGARLCHRPDVRRRHDRGDHGRRVDRARRHRRRDRGRRRAHGPPPDGVRRRPQPAVHLRAPGRPVRAGHGHDRGEPARPVPGRSPASGPTPTRRPASGKSPLPTRPARSSPTWSRSRSAAPRRAGALPPSTSRRARTPRWPRWPG